YVEPGISPETIQSLKDMGHVVRPVVGVQRALMGRGQIIQQLRTTNEELVWAAGSDPRADGQAVPQI
ncbi:hypothetical protein FRC15_005611, partial [Serendipita sp. 397]